MRRLSPVERFKVFLLLAALCAFGALALGGVRSSARAVQQSSAQTTPTPAQAAPPKVEGCVTCHGQTEPMHKTRDGKLRDDGRDGQSLACTSCHGGNPFVHVEGAARGRRGDAGFDKVMRAAHVSPRFPERWVGKDGKYSSANPERTNALLAAESREFVRFINPGDFRVAELTCASTGCHSPEVAAARNSMMRHGGMLWGAAVYNNGGYPIKDMHFGESYSEESGAPERMIQLPAPSPATRTWLGALSRLNPLPRWEISQPGNLLRVFERGGRGRSEVGLPERESDPGKPDKGLSARGLGTLNRTDPVYLGLQKTRLLDPTLNFLGTNDHPGDYRSSGCTACHVVYANDRSVVYSSPVWAKYGNRGTTATEDEQLKDKRDEPGHPIKHQFTSQIPTSQCMTCHMHPGNNMVATYLGLLWWDNETDARAAGMYPSKQRKLSAEEEYKKLDANPEGSSVRGNWSEPDFLQRTGTDEFNSKLSRTQFADFHGHGWMFRAVYKRDREGHMLDSTGARVEEVTPAKLKQSVEFRDNESATTTQPPAGVPVHLKDIHLEKGMHCVDCHFRQDAHGNGVLYNEPRAAIEIDCIDCHGTIKEPAKLTASGFAAGLNLVEPADGQSVKDGNYVRGTGRNFLRDIKTPFTRTSGGRQVAIPVFERIASDRDRQDSNGKPVKLHAGDIVQNSMVEPGKWWRVKQTAYTVTKTKGHEADYNWRSAYAKTVRIDENKQETWGDVPADEAKLAHSNQTMTCYTCHSAWMTSCFGCHLSMRANAKMPNRHFEGETSRNFTQYNFQVLRDDVFMLGRDGTVTGRRVAPAASRSAILVSSQNQNREWIYSQQQTVSAEGFSGQSFATHVPHTVRTTETKTCSDCHVSDRGDNNAWMAQLLMQGTNFVNFMGRYVYVAAEDALEVVPVTERDEPQAVYGSTLHEVAYPDDFKEFVAGGRKLKTVYEHKGNPEVLGVQLRGEYAYVAAGEGGLRVYDVAQIDHKGFSERITTAPVSRFGQKFWVDTKYATAVASPTTLGVDPARWRLTADGRSVDPTEAKRLWDDWMRLPQKERETKPAPLVNEEQPIHPLYAYLYVVDREEGLILVNAATLLDGDPLNNYLKRAMLTIEGREEDHFNPNGLLSDANNITIAGTFAYVTTGKGLVVIDIDEPTQPRVVKVIGEPQLRHPRSIAVQFRYGFVVEDEGLKVVDLTMLPPGPCKGPVAAPCKSLPRAEVLGGALVPLAHAHDVYVARTYAYVANGEDGVAIVDVTKPEAPRLSLKFNAGGELNDTHQVKVAMTNASLFAYVADGKNGLRILQLTSPETMPTYGGFSPAPEPRLIATFKTKGPAVAVSKGLDRDRAVDESGNQLAVFGRRGARPFTLEEMQRLYLFDGRLRTVLDPEELKSPPPRTRDPFR
ncbi:MAG TPA: hypothetical protein VGP08_06450 [Pyrinomonadaceae bacterium]|jgi:hypothetical protein|nr:hypothetical protein [Pyrinomonadaceae bacterium]